MGICWYILEIAPMEIFTPALMIVPAYLAVHFFLTLFDKGQTRGERRFRLAYYGWPTLAILGLGIYGKIGLTAESGSSLRMFLWSLLEDKFARIFFSATFLAGLLVLVTTLAKERARTPSRSKTKAPADP
ncbi:MAG: hypothetical protein HYU64_10695 [Armatimonadetes bacterium]|nr:hypothetical protein [Armatimonadota bacterium]